jgi:hypothetical protein
MKNSRAALFIGILLLMSASCKFPEPPKKSAIHEKYNFIILLDLSDRIIVQENQPARDKEIIRYIYSLFQERVKKDLYIKSRDEIKVVIAPQRGANLPTNKFEDRLYINMDNIKNIFRKRDEDKRREEFFANLDTLYQKAQFSKVPEDYYGADIWKYFYEDLKSDYSSDTLTKNFLFILTDGYPIVGKDRQKLQPIKDKFPGLNVVLVEAAPRDKDMEWDKVMDLWGQWFKEIGIKHYTMIKRMAISKEKEELANIVNGKKGE